MDLRRRNYFRSMYISEFDPKEISVMKSGRFSSGHGKMSSQILYFHVGIQEQRNVRSNWLTCCNSHSSFYSNSYSCCGQQLKWLNRIKTPVELFFEREFGFLCVCV